jgi:D-3-phosphoglycerate dehydrogenase
MAAPVISVPDDFPSVFDGSVAHARCRELGETRVVTARGADEEAELIKRIDRATIVINIRAHAHFTDAVFAACPTVKMVSVWGTGVDNFDLAAAGRRGVTICNTPGVNAFAVAEHAIALMLAVARRIPRIDREMREGKWPREQLVQCLGKTLGVVGTGKIGARVIEIGRALGMKVLAYSARGDDAHVKSLGATPVSKETLLREADFISLNLRLSPETRGFLSRRDLGLVKKGAILINTGRGALVEREALLDALSTGRLGGAGLDVFHDEPLKPDDPLLAMPSAVLSPHHAGQTPEVVRDGLLAAVENVANYLAGRPTNVVVAPVR